MAAQQPVQVVVLVVEIGTVPAAKAATIEIIVVVAPVIIVEPVSTPMQQIVADTVWYGVGLVQDSLIHHMTLELVVLLDMLAAAAQDHGFGPVEVLANVLSTTWTITDKDMDLQQVAVAELDT